MSSSRFRLRHLGVAGGGYGYVPGVFLRAVLIALLSLVIPVMAGAASFDLWSGDSQAFGQLGNPQRWVNILGNVSDPDGITGLTYTHNGGPSRTLSLGPDTRRLLEPDDFNIEIDFAELLDGPNQIVLTAMDSLGDSTQHVVTLDYTQGNTWPRDFTAQWGSALEISELAQVVDGLWSLVVGGLRPDVMGYDRIVAIGDVGWTDYEHQARRRASDWSCAGAVTLNSMRASSP